jgi:pimeloyl-ACP methyl ester carboxylesterase
MFTIGITVLCWPVIGILAATNSASSASDALAKIPSRFARMDNYKIHYKSLGQGNDALVFIHGWTCDLNFWKHQVPAFEKGPRLLLVDLPGHGQSDKPQIAYTMDFFARAVDAVMQDAKVSKAVLVGHSMGTPVIRQFYRLFPVKTLALIAVDGSLKPYTTDPAQIESFIKPLRGPNYLARAERMIDGMLTPQMPTALREEIKTTMLKAPQHVMVSAMEGMWDPKIWTKDRIEVPVQVLLAKSPFWTADYEAYLRGFIKTVDFRIIDGVGHFLMMEKPEIINNAIQDFLKQNHLLLLSVTPAGPK